MLPPMVVSHQNHIPVPVLYTIAGVKSYVIKCSLSNWRAGSGIFAGHL